jgi:hypothetical protein
VDTTEAAIVSVVTAANKDMVNDFIRRSRDSRARDAYHAIKPQ